MNDDDLRPWNVHVLERLFLLWYLRLGPVEDQDENRNDCQ